MFNETSCTLEFGDNRKMGLRFKKKKRSLTEKHKALVRQFVCSRSTIPLWLGNGGNRFGKETQRFLSSATHSSSFWGIPGQKGYIILYLQEILVPLRRSHLLLVKNDWKTCTQEPSPKHFHWLLLMQRSRGSTPGRCWAWLVKESNSFDL